MSSYVSETDLELNWRGSLLKCGLVSVWREIG